MAKSLFVECPECGSSAVRSERMRGFKEKCLALFGFYAFSCTNCYARFLERPMQLTSVVYAKCPRCLRMDLTTWDLKYYRVGSWMEFKIWLGAHRWRCEPCRKNFVSWRSRKLKYVRPAAGETSTPAQKS